MKYQTKEEFEKRNMFGTGKPNIGFAKYFIGESFLNPLTNFREGEFPLFNVAAAITGISIAPTKEAGRS